MKKQLSPATVVIVIIVVIAVVALIGWRFTSGKKPSKSDMPGSREEVQQMMREHGVTEPPRPAGATGQPPSGSAGPPPAGETTEPAEETAAPTETE